MTKRDLAQEILSRTKRQHTRGGRWGAVAKKLDGLADTFNFVLTPGCAPPQIRKELIRYLPVAHVAALEGYLRMAYADLIDHGDPFLSNASNFKDIKLNLDTFISTQKNKLTSGQLISHFLPHKSLSDIENNFSILLGTDFKETFKKQELLLPNASVPTKMALAHEPIWRGISELFKMRHIVSHELGTKVDFGVRNMRSSCQQLVVFIVVTDIIIRDVLREPAP